MGLFDKLFDKGAKAFGDVVTDKLTEVLDADQTGQLREAVESAKAAVSSTLGQEEHDSWQAPGSQRGKVSDTRNFEEKLRSILQNAGNYELRQDISPIELEQEFGREIFTRGGNYCEPENITYGIYQGGIRILFIRLWTCYPVYMRTANRQIKRFCDANGVRMLDFFDYMPNEEKYMEQRITEQLV